MSPFFHNLFLGFYVLGGDLWWLILGIKFQIYETKLLQKLALLPQGSTADAVQKDLMALRSAHFEYRKVQLAKRDPHLPSKDDTLFPLDD